MRPLLLLFFTTLTLAQEAAPASPKSDPFAAIPDGPDKPSPSAEDLAIIARVEKIQAEFERQKREVVAAAVSKFNIAAQNDNTAVDFYFACLGLVQSRTPVIDSSPADSKRDQRAEQEQAEARRKAMIEDAYGTPGRGAALKLQLEYLVFTLEAGKISKKADVIARFREFAGRAATVAKTYATPGAMPERKTSTSSNSKSSRSSRQQQMDQRQQQMEQRIRQNLMQTLDQSALGSLFAQAYNLGTYAKEPEGWSSAPLDLQQKYETVILPYYREIKPTELNQVWDEYLGYTIVSERSKQDDARYAEWASKAYKDLQWAKWLDIARHGQRSIAVAELANLISQNPAHPTMEKWLADLLRIKEEILNPNLPPLVPEPSIVPATPDSSR